MGSSNSTEDDIALPQQQVVRTSHGSMAAGSVARAVPGAREAGRAATRCEADQVHISLAWAKGQRLERAGSWRHVWHLHAQFEAKVPCELQAAFHCVERPRGDGYLEFVPADAQAPPSFRQSYPEGTHTLVLEGQSGIDLQRYPLNVFWKYSKGATDVIPIVLSLSAPNIQSVLHLALAQTGKELDCKLIRQKAVVNGREYVLQEIYGLAEMGGDDQHDESSVGEQCVICLSDPRTTAMLPCRHLCVCEDCGGALMVRGDRCPICRGNVTGLHTFKLRSST